MCNDRTDIVIYWMGMVHDAQEKMMVTKVVALFLLSLHASHAFCPDFVSASTITCQLIFDHLQTALLDRPLNLYNLRKMFLPLTHSSQSLVNVSYHITITPTANEPCPGSEELANDTYVVYGPSYGLLPFNTTRLDVNFGWTSKAFYTIFHPAMVNRLQPQLLHQLLVLETAASRENLIDASWNGVGPVLTVELILGPIQLPCLPVNSEIFDSLMDMTALLSIFAETHQSITNWNIEELGYVISGAMFSPEWYLNTHIFYTNSSVLPKYNTIFTIIISLSLSILAYYYILKRMPSSPRDKNFLWSHTLLWISVVSLLYIDIILISFEVIQLWIWCEASTCSDSAAQSKLCLLGYIFIFNVILFIVFSYYYLHERIRPNQYLLPGVEPFIAGLPLLSLLTAFIILVNIFIQLGRKKTTFIHSCVQWPLKEVKNSLLSFLVGKVLLPLIKFVVMLLPFVTINTFLAIFVFSIVPVILEVLVYPFQTIAAYSFYAAYFMVLVLVSFLVNYVWKRYGFKYDSLPLCFLLTLTPITVIILYMINIPFTSLYQLISSGTLTNNPITLAIISIAPTLLLSSPLVWLLKNKIVPAFDEGDIESELEEGEAEREGEREEEREEGVREDLSEVNEGQQSKVSIEMSAVLGAGDVTERCIPIETEV